VLVLLLISRVCDPVADYVGRVDLRIIEHNPLRALHSLDSKRSSLAAPPDANPAGRRAPSSRVALLYGKTNSLMYLEFVRVIVTAPITW
jgi:hypothetical protein